jgi:acyl carrier protein
LAVYHVRLDQADDVTALIEAFAQDECYPTAVVQALAVKTKSNTIPADLKLDHQPALLWHGAENLVQTLRSLTPTLGVTVATIGACDVVGDEFLHPVAALAATFGGSHHIDLDGRCTPEIAARSIAEELAIEHTGSNSDPRGGSIYERTTVARRGQHRWQRSWHLLPTTAAAKPFAHVAITGTNLNADPNALAAMLKGLDCKVNIFWDPSDSCDEDKVMRPLPDRVSDVEAITVTNGYLAAFRELTSIDCVIDLSCYLGLSGGSDVLAETLAHLNAVSEAAERVLKSDKDRVPLVLPIHELTANHSNNLIRTTSGFGVHQAHSAIVTQHLSRLPSCGSRWTVVEHPQTDAEMLSLRDLLPRLPVCVEYDWVRLVPAQRSQPNTSVEEQTDRRDELRANRAAPRNLPNQYVAPRNEIETRIAHLWVDTLGISPIGINDSFFELGGHSMLGIQLVARVREEFRVEFAMRELFEAPSIAEMAERVVAGKVAAVESEDLSDLIAMVEGSDAGHGTTADESM